MIRKRYSAGLAASVVAAGTLLALPSFSAGDIVDDVVRGVDGTVDRVAPGARSHAPSAGDIVRPGRETRQTPTVGTYQPPLHGAVPHGQGSVATLDVAPSGTRPLNGDPSGGSDQSQDREEAVVGRARGEQGPDGTYNGHITIVSLFGNEILGVDSTPGQSNTGPLEAVQAGILDQLCKGSNGNVCLEVLRADSSTTQTGSTNSFAVARASVGGAQGINATAAESNGNIGQDANCQNAHGDSTVANATVGTQAVASVARSTTDSSACRDGSQSQNNTSSVINLFGTGVPIPAAGCANGAPDTETGLPTLLPIVCNPDDTSGAGEAVAQATAPYGVREALTVFALEAGGTSLLKATTAASESRAAAPAAPEPPETPEDPEGPDTPNDDDTPDDGDDDTDDPDDREDADGEDLLGATAGPDDDDQLPFTGADLLLILLFGSITLAGGLALRRTAAAWQTRA